MRDFVGLFFMETTRKAPFPIQPNKSNQRAIAFFLSISKKDYSVQEESWIQVFPGRHFL